MTDGNGDERGLAVEILSYFVENPDAVDDLQGIAGWRLMSARVKSTVESTQQVLDLLVSKGYLRKIITSSGPLFQINEEKRVAAERFLRNRGSEDSSNRSD